MKRNATKVFTIEPEPHSFHYEEEEDLPRRHRHCTNTLFLLLFITFLSFVSYIIIDVILTKNSNPNLVIHGYDNFGNICGQKNQNLFNLSESGQDMTKYPYLLIESEINLSLRTRCVEECPTEGFFAIAFYRCIPQDSRLPLLIDAYNTTRTFLEDIVSDMSLCWKEITYVCSVSLVVSLVILVLLRFLANFIIWVTLLALSLTAVTGSAYIWLIWNYRKSQLLSAKLDTDGRAIGQHVVDQWFIAGVCASLVTIIFITIVTFMRKRIRLVAILFREAGKAIGDMPFILTQPFWTFALLFAVSFLWIYGLIYIQSTRVPFLDLFTGFVSYRLDPFYRYMKWCLIFAYLWTVHLILCSQHFVVSGSVALWFFKRNKLDLNCPQLRMIWILMRYHLGSIAMGSLFVTSIKMIRIVFKRFNSIFNRYKGSCDQSIKLCRCCLWLIETLVIYLSKNAFIEIAIYGEPYCAAAKRAFSLVSDNAARVVALNSVGDFLLFVAKICVVCVTALVSVQMIEDKSALLNYYWSPVIICSLFAYFISHCFLSIYEIAIDTLFLCFIDDWQQNDGITKPYHMSKRLIRLVEITDGSPNIQVIE